MTATSRGQTAAFGAVAGALFGRLPRQLADAVSAEIAAGRRAAAEGAVDHNVSDVDEATEGTTREQDQVRKVALEKLLPPMRTTCAVGLECLDPADQHPYELQAWLDDPDARTLILAGPTGNGKSRAAYAAAAQAARYGAAMWNPRRRRPEKRRLIVRGGPVNDFLTRLQPSGSPDPAWKVWNEAVWAELWLGDDLGAELDDTASSFMRKKIADLLDARLERHGRQIYTTNLSSDDLKDRLKDRLWSRLHDHSTLITFTGPDRRVRRELKW